MLMEEVKVKDPLTRSVDQWIELYNQNKGEGCYLTLMDLIEQSCKSYSHQIAVSNMGGSLSYRELQQLSSQLASFFQKQYKIKKGDRIAIMLPNCLQYYVVLHAIIRCGAIIVNVNPMYKARELQHQLNDADCETIVIISLSAAVLEEVISETKIKNIVLTDLGDFLGIKGTFINLALKYIKRMIKPFKLPQAIPFKKALSLGAQQDYTPVASAPGDVALLQYTGGTTGVAKGAMISHANICANVWQCRTWAGKRLKENARSVLCPLPLYHIFSLMINAFVVLTIGGEVILVTDPRNIPQLVKIFQKKKLTMLTSLNTLFAALLANPKFRDCDFSSLALSVGGGMATRPTVAEEWQRVTGNVIIDGYGLTETSPVVSINPIESDHFSGTVGKATSNTEVEIRDDQGGKLATKEYGEICVRGPQVMLGYWRNPDETALVLSEDGWLKTGDMGFIDEQGLISIVDRKKELISVSGFKVYPNEVEEVLTSHPGISEAAVIGVPDQVSGEHVKAFVVRKDLTLSVEDIIAYCHENLTGYKRPHEVEFRDSLPKSNVGKVLRRVLREEERAQ
jgi:long-chain acyl-CoA synthetase